MRLSAWARVSRPKRNLGVKWIPFGLREPQPPRKGTTGLLRVLGLGRRVQGFGQKGVAFRASGLGVQGPRLRIGCVEDGRMQQCGRQDAALFVAR